MNNCKDNRRQIFRLFLISFLFAFFSSEAGGGILFSDLDLSFDNQLLFRAANGSASSQDVLFAARLPAPSPGENSARSRYTLQQLTAFPEKIDLLEGGRTLQIRNAFGAVRTPVSGGLPVPIPGLPSFAGGNPYASGEEMVSSGDGRWLLYLDPVSPAFGNLVMIDVYSGAKIQVASALERPEKIFPAVWSPDSRFFIYEREGKLYYFMNGTSPASADEKTRFIGEGTVNSISWNRSGDFYYLRGATVFRVRGSELATRALYADILEIGVVEGKIPFEFDPYFDSFWIAPDARSLLVSKARRSLFYYPLNMNNAGESSETVLPYLLLPRSCSGINVLWPAGGLVTILVSIPANTGTQVRAWRLKLPETGKGAAFISLPPPDLGAGAGSFPSGSLSPDGSLALFWGTGGIVLYDYAGWKPLEILSLRPGFACLWIANSEFIIGDDRKIERIRLMRPPGNSMPIPGVMAPVLSDNTGLTGAYRISRREMICLSRTSLAAFEVGSFRILAKSGDAWFVTDGRNPWAPISNPRVKNSSQISPQYRVYLEKQGSGIYANLPFIRNTTSVGTFSLFPPVSGPGISYFQDAGTEQPYVPGMIFTRGVRTGNREVALCFDLYDDDQGLPGVLDALNRFGIRATFFLNGEFLRRHPEAVSEIVSSGHETASMFFSLMDLSDARYRAGTEFIARGLARNEDEFFRVTGKELALFWHPPWYTVSPDIATAAAAAGYITTGRDVDPQDWVSRDDEKKLGLIQRSPSQMVDRIMEAVRPGSIIPIRLGLLQGGRNDYLFNRINVLLDALAREGYKLVPVSTLIEHAK